MGTERTGRRSLWVVVILNEDDIMTETETTSQTWKIRVPLDHSIAILGPDSGELIGGPGALDPVTRAALLKTRDYYQGLADSIGHLLSDEPEIPEGQDPDLYRDSQGRWVRSEAFDELLVESTPAEVFRAYGPDGPAQVTLGQWKRQLLAQRESPDQQVS